MKYVLLFLFFLYGLEKGYAQEKIIWGIDIGYGGSNYIGKGADHNSYMVGSVPVENDFTKNPFGKKIRAALSGGISAQSNSIKKTGFISSIEFLRLGSRLNLNGVTYPVSQNTIRPANGTTTITSNEVSISLSRYKKLGTPYSGLPCVFMGLAYSYVTFVNEKGKAIDYTITGEFISNIYHQRQNYFQIQTGMWFDLYLLRLGFQYRLALNGLSNPVPGNGQKIRPQSIFFKICYFINQ
jgi:hypothetical protein